MKAEMQFEEILKSKRVILFMPHFNQNVNLFVERNFVHERDGECFRLRGRIPKNIVLSEWIFCQKDLDEMKHIFEPKK